ncbi:esterase, PHB depolymerase family [Arboricoccus pini]|uniref:Esterase, PHB depolymerase family n=2 Tax=Arboricoccus pini TaxID=1963835 RepID=A0A212RRR1_9PROT|nr:esterase, PHB depolymerase family [Arboricoccus pini]
MREFGKILRKAAQLTQSGNFKEASSALMEGLGTATSMPRTRERPAAPPGRFLWRDHDGPTGTRRYKLYVPAGYRGQEMPLLLMLHGCTQAPDDFAEGTRMNHLAEDLQILVAYPAQAGAANPQRCWNWFRKEDQAQGSGEPAIMAGIVEDIMRDYGVDRRRIFAAGHSAGGAAAMVLGQTYPSLFAAVGVNAGLPFKSATNAAQALSVMREGPSLANLPPGVGHPTIVFHGAVDKTVNPANARAIIAQALGPNPGVRAVVDELGTGTRRPVERTRYLDSAGRLRAELWLVEGLGHAWSGGETLASHTDPRGPDASREMLRFFLEQPTDS